MKLVVQAQIKTRYQAGFYFERTHPVLGTHHSDEVVAVWG